MNVVSFDRIHNRPHS